MAMLRLLLLIFAAALLFNHGRVAAEAGFVEEEIGFDGSSSAPVDPLQRVVTFRNNFQNQTLMLLWTGSLEDDESHISNPILVTEAQRGETIKVNTQVASYQQAYSFPYYSFHKELALTPVANQRYVDVSITTSTNAIQAKPPGIQRPKEASNATVAPNRNHLTRSPVWSLKAPQA
jgi:hypothetical protein